MSTIIDEGRIEAVAQALSRVPIEAVKVIEFSDPQYKAVKRIALAYGAKSIVAIVANALVSYRLPVRGEIYWSNFADYLLSKGRIDSFEEFIESVREFVANRMQGGALIDQKLGRIWKALDALRELYMNPLGFTDLTRLLELLASHMKSRGVEKTIVFAVKMAYYFYTALGIEVSNTYDIPLPVDRRVAIITSSSRILHAPVRGIMGRYRDEAIEAWGKVSRLSDIPLINMDAIIWLPAQNILGLLRRGIDVAREEYAKRLVEYSKSIISWDVARRIAAELLYDYPIE
jgi:DNA-(apurinic or apyrimidinic site) lyase